MSLSEDRLFDDRVIGLIEYAHSVRVDRSSIRRRVFLDGYEIDVIFTAYTEIRRLPRIFIVELKDRDIHKVLVQAIRRSIYAHYTYAIIARPHWDVVDYIIRYWKSLVPYISKSGIGIISYCKGYVDTVEYEPILIRPAKFNYNRIKTVLEYMVKNHA